MKLQIHTPLCALCALLVFVSCLNDDRNTKTSLDIPDEWVTYVSEDVFPIDENYKPSQHEIAKTWVGEYYGYDVEQEKNGLFRYDRSPKFEKNLLRSVFAEKPSWSDF